MKPLSPSAFVFTIFLRISMWSTTNGLESELQLFTKVNCQGQSFRTDRSQKDLECLKQMFNSTVDSIRTGRWWAFATTADNIWHFYEPALTEGCVRLNEAHRDLKAAIRLGVEETSTPSISIVPVSITQEIFVTDRPLEPYANYTDIGNSFVGFVITAGKSNWTIFEEGDFQGPYQCLIGKQNWNFFNKTSISLETIGSVMQTCLPQQDDLTLVYPVNNH